MSKLENNSIPTNITNQIRDYLYEMDARVESLINYTDIKNPN